LGCRPAERIAPRTIEDGDGLIPFGEVGSFAVEAARGISADDRGSGRATIEVGSKRECARREAGASSGEDMSYKG
jgi:hypothetical protein